MLALAAANGELVEISDEFYLHADVEQRSRQLLAERLAEHHPDLVPIVEQAKAAVVDFQAWLEEKHRSEHASYYGVMLWVLMMLEQWLQLHTSGLA